MATIWKTTTNNATTTLATTLTNTATSITLSTGEGAKFPASGPFWITVFGDTVEEGSEIILVGSRSTDTLSGCTRGQQGTSAAQWAAGSNLQLLWTAGNVDQIQSAIAALETGTVLTDLTYTQDIRIQEAGTSVVPQVTFLHSRGTVGTPTQTNSADVAGRVSFQGHSGSGFVDLACIEAQPDGQSPGVGDSPGKLVFQTTPDTTASPTNAFVIRADKTLQAGSTPVTLTDSAGYIQTNAIKTGTTNNGKVLTSGATEGSATWQLLTGLPSQTGNSGKFLTTDGANASWALNLPDQTGNNGKYLTTNGTIASWATVSGGSPGPDSIGASEMKETEDITLLGLILHEAGTSAITMQQFRRCRTSTSSPTVVAANDASMIDFEFYDGSLYRVAARIKASVDATPGSGDMPGRIEFWVTKDDAASPPTDAVLVLKQNQCVGIGETTPSAAKLVITEGSTFAKPLLELNQTDQDEPFFSVVGTSAADTTKNISTAAIGTFTGRIRVEINGADYWIPYYAAT